MNPGNCRDCAVKLKNQHSTPDPYCRSCNDSTKLLILILGAKQHLQFKGKTCRKFLFAKTGLINQSKQILYHCIYSDSVYACKNRTRFTMCVWVLFLLPFPVSRYMFFSAHDLKGQCHEIFCFWFFRESVSPQALFIPWEQFQIFSKFLGEFAAQGLPPTPGANGKNQGSRVIPYR